MMEKLYGTLKHSGGIGIALGVIMIVTGLTAGIISIVNGAILLKHRSEITF